ncbi:MAG: ribonuclease H-like domain-containing protein [Candidatus Omnitrophica bacterium]|nr:ribonuclease H-like domain-containing protein [Candidatus Omnitrophota bacterium]
MREEMDLKRSIEDFDLVFLDLETTGLDVITGDAICEIGAFKVRGRKTIDKFHSLINPKKSMPREAYLIHGINDEELKDAPYFNEVADRLLSFLGDCTICAYNAKFDMGFLEFELKRIEYPSLGLFAIDILGMVRKTLKLPKNNLGAIAQFFEIKSPNGLHRALDDAFVASRIFFKVKDIIKEKKLENLEDFISLYGLNNEVFKLKEEPKIFLIKEAIVNGAAIKARYFSCDNVVVEEKIKPVKLSQENKNFYLWCHSPQGQVLRIRLNRIFEVEIA